MTFFPIISASGAHGWTVLSNFPPNNWESTSLREHFVNVTWASNNIWFTKTLGIVSPGDFYTVHACELVDIVPEDSLPLLSLTQVPLPVEANMLPNLDLAPTSLPVWRASIGLSTDIAQTSYQGEIDSFPPQGTLLTFGPLLQLCDEIHNYLLLINLEKSPVPRWSDLEVYDSLGDGMKARFLLRNNMVNCISLDSIGFKEDDLPVFICRNMSGIPLFFSRSTNGAHLSLEHSHPPASFAVHGQRWEVQKLLKNHWFQKISR